MAVALSGFITGPVRLLGAMARPCHDGTGGAQSSGACRGAPASAEPGCLACGRLDYTRRCVTRVSSVRGARSRTQGLGCQQCFRLRCTMLSVSSSACRSPSTQPAGQHQAAAAAAAAVSGRHALSPPSTLSHTHARALTSETVWLHLSYQPCGQGECGRQALRAEPPSPHIQLYSHPGSPWGWFSDTATMNSSPVGDRRCGSCRQGNAGDETRRCESCTRTYQRASGGGGRLS